MSLHSFQTALGRLVRARQADGAAANILTRLPLGGDERKAFGALLAGRGLDFTREVQRSWCKGRARNAAYLTLSLLDEDERQRLLDEWVEAGGGIASFFAGEAIAFLDFLALHLHGRTHALSICRMEQAVHRANAAGRDWQTAVAEHLRETTVIARAPHASLVEFYAEPEQLLHAVQAGAVLPQETPEPVVLLFGPELADLFERADQAEAALWRRLAAPASWDELLREEHAPSVIERMISLGIVCPLAPHT
ncbi:MAG TPA: hypothetical protein VF472_25960 [Burkholderiaceae bacterium]